MGNKNIIDDLLDFEQNSRVLDFRYDYKDILIWAGIRYYLFRRLIDGENTFSLIRGKKIAKYKNFVQHNSFRLSKKDVLYINSSTNWGDRDGEWKDKTYGDYLLVTQKCMTQMLNYDNSLDFERMDSWEYSTDVCINKLIEYEAKRKNNIEKEEKKIDECLDYLKKEMPVYVEAGIWNGVKENATKIVKQYPAYYKYYEKLMDVVQPKIVFVQCGMFCHSEIKVINDCGAKTAEIQHGFIDKSHIAYSYSKQIAENKEYREYMPTYFLTFGEYWGKDMDMPSQIVNIGSPIMKKQLVKYQNSEVKKNTILIITGDAVEPYISFVDDILKYGDKKYEIIIKLHPCLPEYRNYYEKFFGNPQVKIEYEGEIHKYIAMAEYIVGDASTALYEAAAMGRKAFIIDCWLSQIYTSKEFGIWIKNGKDFLNCIKKGVDTTVDGKMYYDLQWENNFKKFLEKDARIIL